MQQVQQLVEKNTHGGPGMESFGKVYQSRRIHRLRYWIMGISGLLLLILFLPWTQNIRARGSVTAVRQEQRPQELQSMIAGRIVRWFVKEGDRVKAGDTLLQLTEVKDQYLDPNLLPRTREQLEAKKRSLTSYKEKVSAASRQLEALGNARELKLAELQNKIGQQFQKIRSDSMDLLAASSDFENKQAQYNRQQLLYDSGLVSLLQVEQRKQSLQEAIAKKTSAAIKLDNSRQEWKRLQLEWEGEIRQYQEKISKVEGERFQALSEVAGYEGDLAKLENQLSNYLIRNGQYYLLAPQDGQVIGAAKSGLQEMVKEGEKLLEIVPDKVQLAVEMFVKPVDLPLLDTGQQVRLVFDGFPALVFSGWPEASYGIFSGKIIAVETALREQGLFRVLVAEDLSDRPWPRELRMGTGASAIALLKDVPVWYELWRNINGFPPDYYKTAGQDKTGKKNGKE